MTSFPEIKNINVSFVEEQNKEAISLPKIVNEYESTYEKETKKSNRFKDIPIDISTKILRSNLREWGNKVSFGKNIPSKIIILFRKTRAKEQKYYDGQR